MATVTDGTEGTGMQIQISRDDAIRLVRIDARKRDLAPWTIEEAVLDDDSDPLRWRVVLDFDDPPLGFPGFIMIDVHATTGAIHWPLNGL